MRIYAWKFCSMPALRCIPLYRTIRRACVSSAFHQFFSKCVGSIGGAHTAGRIVAVGGAQTLLSNKECCVGKQSGWATALCAGRCLRSEEHTSELQSRGHLVCSLLL